MAPLGLVDLTASSEGACEAGAFVDCSPVETDIVRVRDGSKQVGVSGATMIWSQRIYGRDSLVVQWLALGAFTAKGPGSVPGWGTKILNLG